MAPSSIRSAKSFSTCEASSSDGSAHEVSKPSESDVRVSVRSAITPYMYLKAQEIPRSLEAGDNRRMIVCPRKLCSTRKSRVRRDHVLTNVGAPNDHRDRPLGSRRSRKGVQDSRILVRRMVGETHSVPSLCASSTYLEQKFRMRPPCLRVWRYEVPSALGLLQRQGCQVKGSRFHIRLASAG